MVASKQRIGIAAAALLAASGVAAPPPACAAPGSPARNTAAAGLVALPARGAAPVSRRLERALATAAPDDALTIWVYLEAKPAQKALPPAALVSERSLRRRAKVRPAGALVDAADQPLDATAVAHIAARVGAVRQRSRWLNAVSVRATRAQIAALRELPEVRRLDLVARWRGSDPEIAKPVMRRAVPAPIQPKTPNSLDYGPSLGQVSQINVPPLHESGLSGAGVLVAHFDNGYRLLSHAVFASTDIVATHDFVDGDVDPAPPGTAPPSWGAHGIATLSVLGGYAPGELIGTAYGASFALARTENDASETPLEEDNWVAAIEWADSLGADVASTSLGYLDYDTPFTSWTWEDMDGNTTAITRAADLAVGRGIVVFNSAGNAGADSLHNTLLAPADGDSVLAVGAVTAFGERSSFSSVGPTTSSPPRFKPDIAAQGSAVRVARTIDPMSYGNSSGTSFACPLAAGVAALLLQAVPDATPLEIGDALRLTGSQAEMPDNLLGWGILNAPAALDWLRATDVAPRARDDWRLDPARPNPFNPTTTVVYRLASPAGVHLQVFDARGRVVRTLERGAQSAGEHAATWNGTDARGRHAASGAYHVRLRATDARGRTLFDAVRTLVLVK